MKIGNESPKVKDKRKPRFESKVAPSLVKTKDSSIEKRNTAKYSKDNKKSTYFSRKSKLILQIVFQIIFFDFVSQLTLCNIRLEEH